MGLELVATGPTLEGANRSSKPCPSCVDKARHSEDSQPWLGPTGFGLFMSGTQVKSEQDKNPTDGQTETNLQWESLGSER